MNLQQEISKDLWEKIEVSYTGEKYSAAVTEGISLLRELVREKTGADLDGTNLFDYAFGGNQNKPPRIKINPYTTQSHFNEQRGYQLMLNGLFTGIRSPRVHDHVEDDKRTADALLCFINHMLGKIETTESIYSVEKIAKLIMEPYFSPQPEYIQPLLGKLPNSKYIDLLIYMFEKRSEISSYTEPIIFAITHIFSKLDKSDQEYYLEMISNETREANVWSLGKLLAFLPDNCWGKLDEISQNRIQQILISEYIEADLGSYYYDTIGDGERGFILLQNLKEQASRFLRFLSKKDEILRRISRRIINWENIDRTLAYFLLAGTISEIAANVRGVGYYMFWEKLDSIMWDTYQDDYKEKKYEEILDEIKLLDEEYLDMMPHARRIIGPNSGLTLLDF